MNCRDALRLLYDVVDKEASESDATQVHEHIRNCRHCHNRFELELMFKNCVEQKGQDSPECHELRQRIIQQLDDIDSAAGEVGLFQPPFRWVAVSVAAAAAIILCIIAAASLKDFHRRQTQFAPFIRAHLAHSTNIDNNSPFSDPWDFLRRHTGIRLEHPPQLPPEAILSVSIDTITGVPFGHIELALNDTERLSLFVVSADCFCLPTSPCRTINGVKMLVDCCKKCNLVGTVRHNTVFMAVAARSHPPEELAEVTSYF